MTRPYTQRRPRRKRDSYLIERKNLATEAWEFFDRRQCKGAFEDSLGVAFRAHYRVRVKLNGQPYREYVNGREIPWTERLPP